MQNVLNVKMNLDFSSIHPPVRRNLHQQPGRFYSGCERKRKIGRGF